MCSLTIECVLLTAGSATSRSCPCVYMTCFLTTEVFPYYYRSVSLIQKLSYKDQLFHRMCSLTVECVLFTAEQGRAELQRPAIPAPNAHSPTAGPDQGPPEPKGKP